ncbi:hypothetical protein [Hymenobacter weizhouensis]|uniref:hypothetical protein n=1 Tax=Hymenobacter sp. YIM 151500-1 TaxID=2987689 RepID=UPI0022274C35|nr:hypothetical protein [Hymenobacter sp. YIM 151500-1]UYZ61403.1 hypothetical protein OIS53_10325 [Hymenobacter sp. YIM 151500-1]
MSTSDNLQITISDADMQKINAAIDTLDQLLKPLLISLTGKDIQRLPKASDGTLPFIEQALDLAEQQPQFAPGYVDVPGLRQDLAAWKQLLNVQRRLQPITSDLNSTTVKLGSEAYVTSLAYYNSVQQAVKQAVSGAQPVADVLKARFEKSKEAKKALGKTSAI